VVKKAQQRLFNLRRLKKFGWSPKTLTKFYRRTIESIGPGTATAPPSTARLSRGWCSLHNTSPGSNYLPSRTPTAPDVTGRTKINKDNNHPSHCMITPLPFRWRDQYSCIKAGTERLKNSFYLKAIRMLNSHH
jgi:hypothetical protein